MSKEWYSAAELAGLPGLPGTDRAVQIRAKREDWRWQKRTGRGGGREYHLTSLPPETQAVLLVGNSQVAPGAPVATDEKEPPKATPFTYDREAIWAHFERKPDKAKSKAQRKLELLQAVMTLVDNGIAINIAFQSVSAQHGESWRTVQGWYHGNGGKPGIKRYERQDWLAALVPGHGSRIHTAEFSPDAWEFLKTHHLNRRAPSLADSYRRTVEAATAHGWTVPSERTVERRMNSEVSRATRVMLREGPEALRQLLPWQRRDKSCFAPGEAVSGDGIKFDKLWVDWGDEILNTTTGWFWQDIYSGKFMAHRIAKTENTDVFRLATYDLTAICLPSYVQIDNTRVAANKAMTAGAKGRHRFKDQPDDALGILLQLGMEPHFTNPDHTQSNPGVKPVERAFGIGNIHDSVASNPKIINRGFSKATAIPVEEFIAIVAEEVKRHNAREKRRSPICGGVKSFDQAFNEAFAISKVRQATEAQRRLLLLMPEVVRATRDKGEVHLKAGNGPMGKPRYWTEELVEFAGHQVVAYYDPEHLEKPVSIQTLDGRFICQADRQDDVAFNDTSASREWGKNSKRRSKAMKKVAAAETRMSELEMQRLYPEVEDVEIPAPGVVQGNFTQKRQVVDGKVVDTSTGEICDIDDEMDDNLSAAIHNLAAQRRTEFEEDENDFQMGFKRP
ncbi:MAG: Mu transposase C-terminal domain-containing protein [Chromatiales bacterium]|nr:Mu transposase C-terminal domain-containing protein [Gammaproteobacteria bacterium]